MIRAIGLAVADLGYGRILAILLEAAAISIAVFVVVGGLLVWFLSGTDPCDLVGMGTCPLGIGGGAIGAIGLTLLAAWFLFPAVGIAVVTMFSDRIAATIEERHYPAAARSARRVPAIEAIGIGLKSAGRLILLNLLALPFYLLLLITGVGPFVLFVIVNGIAFGRDLAELASARHGDRRTRRSWLRQTRVQQHLLGIVISVLFLVPFANLLAPVLGIAAGVHFFNSSWARVSGRSSPAAVS